MLAQAFRSEVPSHYNPYSVVVAASRLACAEPTEHRALYNTRLWRIEDDLNPRAILYDWAVRLHSRAPHIEHKLLPELSLLIDAALATCVWIDADPSRNQVHVIYTKGMAPEQADASALHGYFSGALAHSSIVSSAIAQNDSPKGLRDTYALIQKAMCPDTKGVRYVGDLCTKAFAQHELMGRIITSVVHGGVMGSRHLASPQFRIDNWRKPGDIAALVVRRLTKRGILLAICQFVAHFPCHVVQSIVPVTFEGSVSAAIFSPRSPNAKLVPGTRTATRIEPPLDLGTPAAVLAKADPNAVQAACVRMAVPFGTAMPRNSIEMAALQLSAIRAGCLRIRPCHPSVRKHQMELFGEITIPVCIACHTILAPVGSRSKTRRVFSVMQGDGTLICSGCHSDTIVNINMAGLVACVTRPGGQDLFCPCSECGVFGRIGGVRGLLPYCTRHATTKDIEPRGHCAICSRRIHGTDVKYVEVASKRFECICPECQTVFPVILSPARHPAIV